MTGSVLIHRALVDVGGHISEKDTETHAARRLRLDAATVEALTLYRSATEQRTAALGTTLTADAFTFSHAPDGSRPIGPQKLTGFFRRLANRLDLDHVRLRDLRHFAATRMLAAGVPVRTVSGCLGHADASTTLGVYAPFRRRQRPRRRRRHGPPGETSTCGGLALGPPSSSRTQSAGWPGQ